MSKSRPRWAFPRSSPTRAARSLRRWASRKRSSTNTLRTPSPAWAASRSRTSKMIWKPAIRKHSTRWVWTSTASCRAWVRTNSAAAPLPSSTSTTRRPSTFCSRPAGPAITIPSSSTPPPLPMRTATRCTCAACWTSTIPSRACPSTRSRALTPSSSGSRPPP